MTGLFDHSRSPWGKYVPAPKAASSMAHMRTEPAGPRVEVLDEGSLPSAPPMGDAESPMPGTEHYSMQPEEEEEEEHHHVKGEGDADAGYDAMLGAHPVVGSPTGDEEEAAEDDADDFGNVVMSQPKVPEPTKRSTTAMAAKWAEEDHLLYATMKLMQLSIKGQFPENSQAAFKKGDKFKMLANDILEIVGLKHAKDDFNIGMIRDAEPKVKAQIQELIFLLAIEHYLPQLFKDANTPELHQKLIQDLKDIRKGSTKETKHNPFAKDTLVLAHRTRVGKSVHRLWEDAEVLPGLYPNTGGSALATEIARMGPLPSYFAFEVREVPAIPTEGTRRSNKRTKAAAEEQAAAPKEAAKEPAPKKQAVEPAAVVAVTPKPPAAPASAAAAVAAAVTAAAAAAPTAANGGGRFTMKITMEITVTPYEG